jgi:hypothetical protein
LIDISALFIPTPHNGRSWSPQPKVGKNDGRFLKTVHVNERDPKRALSIALKVYLDNIYPVHAGASAGLLTHAAVTNTRSDNVLL